MKEKNPDYKKDKELILEWMKTAENSLKIQIIFDIVVIIAIILIVWLK